jgi:hypothetical protein
MIFFTIILCTMTGFVAWDSGLTKSLQVILEYTWRDVE